MEALLHNFGWILLAISEVLALSPLKSNSIVMLVINACKSLAGSDKAPGV